MMFTCRCNGCYTVNIVACCDIYPMQYQDYQLYSLYAYLSGLNGNQIMYAIQASTSVVMADVKKRHSCRANLLNNNHAVNEEIIYIGFDRKNVPLFYSVVDDRRQAQVLVWFEVKHSYFQNLTKSVDRISDEALCRIVPTAAHFQKFSDSKEIAYPTKFPLDEYQYHALKLILFSRSKAPVLVLGPFGSGKTRLLSVATLLIMEEAQKVQQNARILVCAYHQHSADTFMTEYFEQMLVDSEHPLKANVVRVTNMYHRANKKHFIRIDQFMDYCDHYYLQEKHLVIVSTFLIALKFSDKFPQGFFTHILIDEGAQSREPDCIAPLCMANNDTRIVIVGDPHQVSLYYACTLHTYPCCIRSLWCRTKIIVALL